jgi:threonine dehydrogenase-like Zn-dependent dehydrogenase
MHGLRRLAGPRLALDTTDHADPVPAAAEAVVAVEAAWLDLDEPPAARIAGSAAVGRVASAGADASHLVGQRVLVASALPCGECDVCRCGGVAACPAGGTLGRDRDGALADLVLAPGRWLCPLGERLELDAVTAAMVAGPAAIAYSMYARAGVAPGQPVAVIGRGPIARLLGRIAEAKGARAVVAAVDEPASAILERLASVAAGERRPRTVFDAGEPGGLALAAALAEPASTIACLARPGGEAPAATAAGAIDLVRLLSAGVTLLGVAGPHPDLLAELAALVMRKELELGDLAEVVPWAALQAGADAAAERARSAGRAFIVTR